MWLLKTVLHQFAYSFRFCSVVRNISISHRNKTMTGGRALHFVFKVGDRSLTAKFYRDILGMKVLRHEEFKEGCDAQCNGPYDGRWSKTMIGYGSEDTHFVIELTYNYGVSSYELGNDFRGLTIQSKESVERAKANGWPLEERNGCYIAEAPGGFKFFLIDEPQPTDKDPVLKVTLASSNLESSINYWNGILGLNIYEQTVDKAVFGFADDQAKLELVDIGTKVDHAQAYGRIAFSVPYDEQPKIEEKIKANDQKIITPLITLDTPGKASVRVIILSDPDGHEICFVDDESYRQLSQFDPEGETLLNRYIKIDDQRLKSGNA